MRILLLLTIVMNIGFVDTSFADEFSDEEFSESTTEQSTLDLLQLGGHLELEQGARISGAGVHKDTDYVMAGRKLRLESNHMFDNGGFFFKLDFNRDEVEKETNIILREARFQYKASEFIDLSVGRQVSTWGVSDMLFINDLFPKNWMANFLGREMEMLKDSSDSVRLTTYWGPSTFDFVYTPKFAADVTPTGCRFGVFDVNERKVVSKSSTCESEVSYGRDNGKISEGELALSVKRNVYGQELALYGYRGFFKSAKSLRFDGSSFTPFHSRLNVFGFSSEGQVGPGILSVEAGYYDSEDDSSGDNYLIENSSIRYLFGYRADLSAKFSLGFQFYQERMMKYREYEQSFLSNNPNGFAYRKSEGRNTYTVRLTYKAQQETLNFSLFSYLRPQDKDSFTKFEVSKKINDDLKITTGVNVFTGKDNYRDREFGMLDDADNAFARLTFSF